MKKVFIKWGFTDDYGFVKIHHIEIVDTMEDADKFIAEMKNHNGSYFHLDKIFEEDYDAYERMKALEKELKALKKRF